jgi:putative transposase
MKNGRYSDAQIMAVLKQAEGGTPVSELCREHGMMPLVGKRYLYR